MTTFGVFFNVFCLFSLSPVAFKSGCTSEYLNYPRDLFFKKLCLGPILSTFNQNLWGREWGNSGINNFNNFLINVSRDSNMYPQLTIAALGQSFSNFHMHTNHLGGLAKMQILPQWVWLELKTAFLTSFPVLLLLVHGPTLNGEDLSHSYPTPPSSFFASITNVSQTFSIGSFPWPSINSFPSPLAKPKNPLALCTHGTLVSCSTEENFCRNFIHGTFNQQSNLRFSFTASSVFINLRPSAIPISVVNWICR